MAVYKTITNSVAADLIVAKNTTNNFGGIIGKVSKITITNVHASAEPVVTVFLSALADGAVYTIAKTKIPINTTLVLEDNVSFDGNLFSLKAQSSLGTCDLDIIVK